MGYEYDGMKIWNVPIVTGTYSRVPTGIGMMYDGGSTVV